MPDSLIWLLKHNFGLLLYVYFFYMFKYRVYNTLQLVKVKLTSNEVLLHMNIY